MYDLKTIKLINKNPVLPKRVPLLINGVDVISDNVNLKKKVSSLEKKLKVLEKKYFDSLVSRLKQIEGKLNTIPIGTEIAICQFDESDPEVYGTVTHETKKFYVINGKRYHKYGLSFHDIKNGKVILEQN